MRLNTNLLASTGYHGFVKGYHIRSHFIQKDSELMT